MAEPTLTIDFKGLCAFVGNAEDPAQVTHVDVIMMAADKVVKEHDLCRHDPLLVFRDKDFERAGKKTPHISFQAYFPDLDEERPDLDIGVWNFRGETLSLKGEKSPPGALRIDSTFEQILSLKQLTGGDGSVRPAWLNGHKPAGVGARLRIDHGVLLGGPHLTNEWGLAEPDEWPNERLEFRQSARWEIYAKPQNEFLRLETAKKQWVQLRPGAHILISNLCPLQQESAGPDVDVLAYYAMATAKVHPDNRLVMHHIKPGAPPPTAGNEVKPTASACPPLRAYAAAA